MFGLSFLSPLFLVGAAAAAIPIAIHLFYRRTEPVVEFAAMRYLRHAPVEQSRRRRLRELILLALRVGALVLLACAFARPYLSGTAAASTSAATVVLIDTSASLSAPAQFERARERAARLVREAPPTHAVAVLAFAHAADVIAPLSHDRAGALAAVAQLKPGAGATRYRSALQRAGEEFAGRSGRIVVVSDLQQSGWDAATEGGIPENVEVELETIEGPAANLAVTSLRVEAGEAIAAVQNFSPRAATEQVVFAVDERRIGAVPVSLAAGGTAEARLPLAQFDAGALSASVTDRDGYTADNVRYAVLDAGNAISVLAVTASGHPSEALYVERALRIVDGAGGFRFRAMSGSAFSTVNSDALGDVDVIMILATRGVEQRGRERIGEFVRSGGGLLMTAGPDVEPAILTQALTGIVSTSWRTRSAQVLSFAPADGRHPVFRLFEGVGTLGNVSFTRAALVAAPEGADVIARYTDGTPALVEERTPGGRVLVFGSDLNYRWNDFPLQPAFVPFIHETLRYLASPRAVQSEYLVGDLPGEAGSRPGVVKLAPVGRTPSGSPGEPDHLRQGYGGPPKLYAKADKARPTADGTADRRAAVNTDPRESDPRPMTADAFHAGISRLKAGAAQQAGTEARRQEDQQALWRYGLLLMMFSLAAEGLLGRRLG